MNDTAVYCEECDTLHLDPHHGLKCCGRVLYQAHGQPVVPQSEVLEAFHPNGQCTCYGEGDYTWCMDVGTLEDAE